MQEANKEKMSLNDPSFNGLNPVLSRGLFAPYHQQAHDINQMLQNQMTIELHNQLKSLEERAVMCMKLKDKALEDTRKRCGHMEMSLRSAMAEVEYWRKIAAEKTDTCKDLARRLLVVRQREKEMNKTLEKHFFEPAQSSTGDNGNHDVADTASNRKGKRRRL